MEKKKNNNVKDIILIISIILMAFFAYQFFTQKPVSNNEEKLRKENELFQLKIDSIANEIEIIKEENKELYNNLEKRDINIKNYERELEDLSKYIDYIQNDITINEDLISETESKLEYLRENPPNRTDEELIISLKTKLNE